MFESKWEADVVLPYIIPAQLHWNSEYSALKAQSKFMHNSWAAAKFSCSWKAELCFPRGSFPGPHRCATSRWAKGGAAAPSTLNGKYEISWLAAEAEGCSLECVSVWFNPSRQLSPTLSSVVLWRCKEA